MTLQEKITAAAEYILEKVALRPEIGLILGSGLGDYADTLENAVKIPYSEIPNFPQPTVEGHAGAFVFGKKRGKAVVVAQGRVHYYEGLPMQEITLPVRVLSANRGDNKYHPVLCAYSLGNLFSPDRETRITLTGILLKTNVIYDTVTNTVAFENLCF